jgi:hypothetical protein
LNDISVAPETASMLKAKMSLAVTVVEVKSLVVVL